METGTVTDERLPRQATRLTRSDPRVEDLARRASETREISHVQSRGGAGCA
jgi:hypothetical protein